MKAALALLLAAVSAAAPAPSSPPAPAATPATSAPSSAPAPAATPAPSSTRAQAAAPAATPAALALARKVQGYYERTKDLEARFAQTYTYSGFGRRQTSSGTLRVKKPGMMRWDYEKPAPKVVAVKGSRLVQHEPEENQAFVDERFDATAMSAAVTFLLGQGDLVREFDVAVDAAGALVLTPKEEDPRVQSIALTVGPEGEVTATRVVDGSGNVNEVRFSDMKRNRGLADALFEVKLPKGVHLLAPPQR